MRLLTLRHNGRPVLGVERPGGRVAVIEGGNGPADMQAVIEGGEAALAALRLRLESAPEIPLAGATLMAPIPVPRRNILCVGKNYYEHAHEFHGSGFDAGAAASTAVPTVPIIFTKAPGCVIASGEPIDGTLDPTASVDYEGELAVVIGRGGRAIPKERAYDHVFGYTIFNDVTARELQKRHSQWFVGKSIDTFGPMGPALVTADEIADITALTLVTEVNGETRQKAKIADLIFDIPTIIATLSASTTLVPGDIIATGTPSGVGIGFNPPRYLKSGDVVRIHIDGIGSLENRVH